MYETTGTTNRHGGNRMPGPAARTHAPTGAHSAHSLQPAPVHAGHTHGNMGASSTATSTASTTGAMNGQPSLGTVGDQELIPFDIEHQRAHLDLFFEESLVVARSTVVVRPLSKALTQIRLNLHSANIAQVRLNGTPVHSYTYQDPHALAANIANRAAHLDKDRHKLDAIVDTHNRNHFQGTHLIAKERTFNGSQMGKTGGSSHSLVGLDANRASIQQPMLPSSSRVKLQIQGRPHPSEVASNGNTSQEGGHSSRSEPRDDGSIDETNRGRPSHSFYDAKYLEHFRAVYARALQKADDGELVVAIPKGLVKHIHLSTISIPLFHKRSTSATDIASTPTTTIPTNHDQQQQSATVNSSVRSSVTNTNQQQQQPQSATSQTPTNNNSGNNNTNQLPRKIYAFEPITVEIDYVLDNPKVGSKFVLPNSSERDHIYPQFYTGNQCGFARNWLPCVDQVSSKCTWDIAVSFPSNVGRTLPSAFGLVPKKDRLSIRRKSPVLLQALNLLKIARSARPELIDVTDDYTKIIYHHDNIKPISHVFDNVDEKLAIPSDLISTFDSSLAPAPPPLQLKKTTLSKQSSLSNVTNTNGSSSSAIPATRILLKRSHSQAISVESNEDTQTKDNNTQVQTDPSHQTIGAPEAASINGQPDTGIFNKPKLILKAGKRILSLKRSISSTNSLTENQNEDIDIMGDGPVEAPLVKTESNVDLPQPSTAPVIDQSINSEPKDEEPKKRKITLSLSKFKLKKSSSSSSQLSNPTSDTQTTPIVTTIDNPPTIMDASTIQDSTAEPVSVPQPTLVEQDYKTPDAEKMDTVPPVEPIELPDPIQIAEPMAVETKTSEPVIIPDTPVEQSVDKINLNAEVSENITGSEMTVEPTNINEENKGNEITLGGDSILEKTDSAKEIAGSKINAEEDEPVSTAEKDTDGELPEQTGDVKSQYERDTSLLFIDDPSIVRDRTNEEMLNNNGASLINELEFDPEFIEKMEQSAVEELQKEIRRPLIAVCNGEIVKSFTNRILQRTTTVFKIDTLTNAQNLIVAVAPFERLAIPGWSRHAQHLIKQGELKAKNINKATINSNAATNETQKDESSTLSNTNGKSTGNDEQKNANVTMSRMKFNSAESYNGSHNNADVPSLLQADLARNGSTNSSMAQHPYQNQPTVKRSNIIREHKLNSVGGAFAYCLPGRLPMLEYTITTVSQALGFVEQYLDFEYPHKTFKLMFVDEANCGLDAHGSIVLASSHLLLEPQVIDQTTETMKILIKAVVEQWFGGYIPMRSTADNWLLLGLVNFITSLFFRKYLGKNEYKWRLTRDMKRVCELDVNQSPLYPLNPTDPQKLADSTVGVVNGKNVTNKPVIPTINLVSSAVPINVAPIQGSVTTPNTPGTSGANTAQSVAVKPEPNSQPSTSATTPILGQLDANGNPTAAIPRLLISRAPATEVLDAALPNVGKPPANAKMAQIGPNPLIKLGMLETPQQLQHYSPDDDEYSLTSELLNLKAPIVIYMLSRQLGSGVLQKLLNQVLTSYEDGSLAHGLSTRGFLKLGRYSSGKQKQILDFADQWIYGSGCPKINVTYTFNKKRNVIEFDVIQSNTNRGNNGNMKFTGPLIIRVHEPGDMYDTEVHIDDHESHFEVPYHPKKKLRKAIDNSLVSKLDWGEDESERLSFDWIRIDPNWHWLCEKNFEQSDYMWAHQLEQDRDVFAQTEAIEALRTMASMNTCTILANALYNTSNFYGVRMDASLALSKCISDIKDENAIKKFLIEPFESKYCIPFETIYTTREVRTIFHGDITVFSRDPVGYATVVTSEDHDIVRTLVGTSTTQHRRKVKTDIVTRTAVDAIHLLQENMKIKKTATTHREITDPADVTYVKIISNSRYFFVKSNDFTDLQDYYVRRSILKSLSLIRGNNGLESRRKCVELLLRLLRFNDNTNNFYNDSDYISGLIMALGDSFLPRVFAREYEILSIYPHEPWGPQESFLENLIIAQTINLKSSILEKRDELIRQEKSMGYMAPTSQMSQISNAGPSGVVTPGDQLASTQSNEPNQSFKNLAVGSTTGGPNSNPAIEEFDFGDDSDDADDDADAELQGKDANGQSTSDDVTTTNGAPATASGGTVIDTQLNPATPANDAMGVTVPPVMKPTLTSGTAATTTNGNDQQSKEPRTEKGKEIPNFIYSERTVSTDGTLTPRPGEDGYVTESDLETIVEEDVTEQEQAEEKEYIECQFSRLNCDELMRESLSEIERYIQLDEILPSFHNSVTCACIRVFAKLMAHKVIPIDIPFLVRYTRPGNFSKVRKTALEALCAVGGLTNEEFSDVPEYLVFITTNPEESLDIQSFAASVLQRTVRLLYAQHSQLVSTKKAARRSLLTTVSKTTLHTSIRTPMECISPRTADILAAAVSQATTVRTSRSLMDAAHLLLAHEAKRIH